MAKKFTLQFSLGNAAFEEAPAYEIARILREAADSVEDHGHERIGRLFDINGNRVGFFATEEGDAHNE